MGDTAASSSVLDRFTGMVFAIDFSIDFPIVSLFPFEEENLQQAVVLRQSSVKQMPPTKLTEQRANTTTMECSMAGCLK